MTCSLPMIGAMRKDPVDTVPDPVSRHPDIRIHSPQEIYLPLHMVIEVVLPEIHPILAFRPGPGGFWDLNLFPFTNREPPPRLSQLIQGIVFLF